MGAILLGSTLHSEMFDGQIFCFAAITAILLQILSNLANDYGDFVKGTDKHRTDRQLAGGNITPKAMLNAIVLFAVLVLGSGIYLLNLAFADNWNYWLTFLGVGVASIIAAIAYTVGKKAYGYNGLGDVFVFIFFGLVGVLATSFLFNQSFQWMSLLPATAYGCLCVGVLNVNNIRDLDKDVLANKITLASKLGKSGALRYQTILVVTAFVGFFTYHLIDSSWSLAPLGALVLGIIHLKKLKAAVHSLDYNQQLKMLSLGSFGVVVLFALGLF